jgi:hypothetical protein
MLIAENNDIVITKLALRGWGEKRKRKRKKANMTSSK